MDKRYTRMKKLVPEILWEFVDRIAIHRLPYTNAKGQAA
jgi:hypothetical protein